MKDQPTYEELKQDREREWRNKAPERDRRYETMQDILKHPWRCPTCGTGQLTVPICPKCRSARIVEF